MKKLIGVFLISVFLITACGGGDSSNEELIAAITAQAKTIEALSQSSAVSTQLPSSSDCANRLEFVADVSIPDGTVFKPGSLFTKTWRLKNTGTCTWTTAYHLVFDLGEQMSAPTKIAFSEPIAPGETTDFSVNMTAPSAPGEYRGDWKLMSDRGVIFGYGKDDAEPIFVVIVVNTSSAANPGGQTGQNGNRRQEGQQGQGGNPQAAVCDAQNPCGCVPPELSDMTTDEFRELMNWRSSSGVDPQGAFGKPIPIIGGGEAIIGVDATINDFKEIHDSLMANGIDIRVGGTYVDQTGIQQDYDSELNCVPFFEPATLGYDELDMHCTGDPLPGVTNFPDASQNISLNVSVISFGTVCWQATIPVVNLCAIYEEADSFAGDINVPECAGGVGGGPGGLATVVPTLVPYTCSPNYQWCGVGTWCCHVGYSCCYKNGQPACCKQ